MAARRNRNSTRYLGKLSLVQLDAAADDEPSDIIREVFGRSADDLIAEVREAMTGRRELPR